jgi:hypothetical protein
MFEYLPSFGVFYKRSFNRTKSQNIQQLHASSSTILPLTRTFSSERKSHLVFKRITLISKNEKISSSDNIRLFLLRTTVELQQ